MALVQIARVDAIPLLFAWMQRMDVADQINAHRTTHWVWEGLSYQTIRATTQACGRLFQKWRNGSNTSER